MLNDDIIHNQYTLICAVTKYNIIYWPNWLAPSSLQCINRWFLVVKNLPNKMEYRNTFLNWWTILLIYGFVELYGKNVWLSSYIERHRELCKLKKNKALDYDSLNGIVRRFLRQYRRYKLNVCGIIWYVLLFPHPKYRTSKKGF